MRRYVQLDDNGIAVSETSTGSMPTGAKIIDVTGRVDGPWLGKIYSAETNRFTDQPVRVDPRPLAEVLIYDPADLTKAEKLTWGINEEMGIQVTVKDAQGAVVTDFEGEFAIPIMPWNPISQEFEGPVRRLALTFTAGIASRTFSGFAASGDYGVDQRVSDLARVAEPLIVTVTE